MLSVLIVEDNVHFVKNIINCISSNDLNLKFDSIAYSGNEAYKLIKHQTFDLILLDLKLNGMSGVELVKKIQKEKLVKYKRSIIVMSSEYELISQINNSQYVFTCLLKPFSFNTLTKSIQQCVINKTLNSNIKSYIRDELQKLNFNPSYNGTKYLEEVIYQVYLRGDIHVDNLSSNIYPLIATKYNKSDRTIYGDIKQSINSMFYDCNESLLKSYFNYSFIVKPKPKEIITTILSKICKKYNIY